MALFVDGPAATIVDLTDQDSALLDVAQNNNINLASKLRLAMGEIGTDLELWLQKPRPVIGSIGIGSLWSPTLQIGQLVVTPALRRWETMHTLELVYRDVYFTQVVDRFEAKWQGYRQLAADAREDYIASGMAAVSDPLPRPQAPVLTTVTGTQNGGEFYASIAWLNKENQEGQASVAASLNVANGNTMVVSPVSASAPPNAVGYQVYAGTSPLQMFRQNSAPVAFGATFQYLPGQVVSGPLPGQGQLPDFVRPMPRTLLRG